MCTIGTGESNTQDQAEDGMYTFYIRSEIPVKSNKYLYDCEAVITIGDGNIGRVFHYVNGKFDLHQRCYKMTDFENVWGKYFYYFFSTRFYDRAMKMTAKATVDSVRIEMISEMYILKPAEINEQKNIADFFTHLDHLITLHQSKPFGHILKVIASYTLYWEQRKLGEIVVIERGGSPRPIEKYITELNDGLNWIKIGDAPTQGRYITKTSEKIKESGLSKTRQVFPGDLILSNSMSFGKPYIMEIEGCIHDGWLLIRDKNNVFDLKFLCHMLSTEYLLNQYKMFAAGSTVNNLNKELVGNASVRFPEMLEQNKIGKYLESLDHLITLHQLEPFKLIFKAIAYRIIDYAKSKPPRYIKYADLN